MSTFAAALAAFVAGVWCLQQQERLPPAATLVALLGFGLGAAVVAFAVARRAPATGALRRHAIVLLAAVAGVLFGFCYAAWVAQARLADELRFEDEGRDVRIVGTVASLPAHLQRGARFEFAVEAVSTAGVQVPRRIALAWFDDEIRVRPAQRWELTVRLRRPHGNFNPGGFDLEAWLLERGVRATGYVRSDARSDARNDANASPRKLDDFVKRPLLVVDRARDHLRDALLARVQDRRYGGVLVALVLGDQRAISESDWLLFNRTGISHLVSISGLHITMIAGLAALGVAGLWRRSPRLLAFGAVQSAAAVAAVITALAYCLLAGWGVPAQRTFLMLATVALAMWLRLGTRPAATLGFAAFAVCLLDPWAVQAPGFWLSFGAVAAIFAVMTGRRGGTGSENGARLKARLKAATRVQLAVTVALVPLTIALFQQVSLVSPLANAIAIPVVSLAVTPLALLAAAFVALPEPLASFAIPLLALAHWLFAVLAQALESAVAWPWATVTLAAPPAWTVVLGMAGVAWMLAPRGWPFRWLGAAWLLPLAIWPIARPAAGEAWITALDIGQGMAVLVETRSHALLYDTGPRFSSSADAGGRVIAPYLRARGIDRLDWLVVSHLDSDHSGGAASILRSLPVGRVLTSVDPAQRPMRDAAQIERCFDGQKFALGELQLRVLHPQPPDYLRSERATNARSCVLEVRMGVHRVLLTGDLPAEGEARLVTRYPDLQATVVSAPHHGSRHSSSEVFVAATRPRWVLVQAGYRNRFAHPDSAVVARYNAAGADVFRTDWLGAVQWRLSGDGGAQVVAARRSDARYWHNQPGKRQPVERQPLERAAGPGRPALESVQDVETGEADGGSPESGLPSGAAAEMITPDQR